jgi:hypothetical protein
VLIHYSIIRIFPFFREIRIYGLKQLYHKDTESTSLDITTIRTLNFHAPPTWPDGSRKCRCYNNLGTTILRLSSSGAYNNPKYIGKVVDLALPNPTAKPKRVNFQRMKKIEDQAIKAVPRVYSIHRCRISPQIASNPAMQ